MNSKNTSELLLSTPMFDVSKESVVLPNGTHSMRYIVQHPGAVVIVPRTAEGKLILLRQYRHAVGEHILEFPAGTLEPKEEPLECAKRELIEETGFAARSWQLLGTLFPAPGFCNELQHLYLAEDLQPASADADEDEILEVLELEYEEVVQAVADDTLRDGKSLAALCRAQALGLLSGITRK